MSEPPTDAQQPPRPDEKGAVVFATGGGGAPPKGDTSYVLLVLSESTGEWMVTNDEITAKSAEQAIRQHAENTKVGAPDSTYVAIPSRSWRPVSVKTKTVTSLVIEEA